MPRVDAEFVKRWKQGGSIDIGCGLERQVMRIPLEAQTQLLREQAPLLSEPDRELLFRFYDSETFEPTLLVNGRAIHQLASEPLSGLSHYRTLRHIGIEPVPSSAYTEIRVRRQVTAPSNSGSVSSTIAFQPDIFLILDRGKKKSADAQNDMHTIDLVIGEIKSSGIMIYPKQSYTHQQAFYGLHLTELIESNTTLRVGNIYLPLLQSAFLPFTTDSTQIYGHAQLHPTFRPQRWGPVIRLNRASESYGIQQTIAGELIQHRRALRSGEVLLPAYKERMEAAGNCEKCPIATKAICDRAHNYVLSGVPQLDMLQGNISIPKVQTV